MIDPKTVCVITPTRDGQVCADYTGGLASCAGLYGGVSFVVGMSVIALARSLVVNAFMRQSFEHLVMIDSDIGFSRKDFEYLMEEHLIEGTEETHAVVVAEYAKRSTGDNRAKGVAQFGLGFTRIHRSVFDALQEVRTSEGDLMVNPFMWEGGLVYDYFPCGASPSNHWMSEDHGFFMLCQLAGIVPRVESRCDLLHWGRVATRTPKSTL